MAVLFIDESKHPKYFLAATVVQEAEVPRLRKVLRAELRKGQRAIHFSKEGDSRRHELLAAFTRSGFQSHLFTSNEAHELDARFECFEQLVKVALEYGETRLVLERDDSVFKFDEKSLTAVIWAHDQGHQLNAKLGSPTVRKTTEFTSQDSCPVH